MSGIAAHYDVVIVGGAAMGSAVAYFLGADPGFGGTVLVVERDPGYAACATALSWGGIRQQFTTPENIRMSLFGATFLRDAPALLAVDGEAPDLAFRERGYLMLAADGATLEASVARQNAEGAEIEFLAPAALARAFSWLATDGLAGGALGRRNEGWFDPHALMGALRRKARALGARFLAGEVVALRNAGRRIRGVVLADGSEVGAGVVVDAAGPAAAAVAAMAGIALPVRPRKRTTFVFDCRQGIGPTPLVIDPSGVAFRPEGERWLAIVSPPADVDPDATDFEPDYAPFEAVVWPALARRVPAFQAIRLAGAWAGHYEVNTFDANAVIGPHPEVAGLLFCNGFSGHGIQHAPAAGRAVAELIAHGGFRTLDLGALGFARILEGRRLREGHVV